MPLHLHTTSRIQPHTSHLVTYEFDMSTFDTLNPTPRDPSYGGWWMYSWDFNIFMHLILRLLGLPYKYDNIFIGASIIHQLLGSFKLSDPEIFLTISCNYKSKFEKMIYIILSSHQMIIGFLVSHPSIKLPNDPSNPGACIFMKDNWYQISFDIYY